jgi:hypothetical protein
MPLSIEPYSNFLDRLDITTLKGGVDLQVENGDIALNKLGDLRMGSPVEDAMFRLVNSWRYNAAGLRLAFDGVSQLRRLQAETDAARSVAILGQEPEGFRKFTDQSIGAALSRAALSGSILVVLSALVEAFRKAAEVVEDDWRNTETLFSGVSLGRLVVAAANSFRHADEWARAYYAQSFTTQQKSSLELLSAAGVVGKDAFSSDASPICEMTLKLIAGDDFERLEREFFGFANGLVLKAKIREHQEASRLK